MSFDQWLLEGESQTLEFKSGFDKATVESRVRLQSVFITCIGVNMASFYAIMCAYVNKGISP